jgi:hypothetical protein
MDDATIPAKLPELPETYHVNEPMAFLCKETHAACCPKRALL